MTKTPYIVNQDQKRGRPREHTLTQFERDCDQRTEYGLRRTQPAINKPMFFGSFFGGSDIYIDGEWHMNTNPQKFYLLGYAYDLTHYGWLYNQNDYEYNGQTMARPKVRGINGLNRTWLTRLLDGVRTIYFYGPDAGMLESMYHLKLKERFRCVNLMLVAKRIIPKEDMWQATKELIKERVLEKGKYTATKPCYRLCAVEHLLGIKRETIEYKKDVDNLHRDWYTPHLRAKALLYNKEDVLNLIKMKRALYSRYKVPTDIEEQSTLQLTIQDIQKFKTRKYEDKL